jgi:ectoine hydroxylase-related dioxygenase (phytanoyl-CoA dioxygenase family)
MVTAAALTIPVNPTRDLARAKNDLDRHGYCLIADALSSYEISVAAARLASQAKAEDQRGISFRDGGHGQDIIDEAGRFKADAFRTEDGGVNQRVFMLVNKGRYFHDLVVHPLVDELVGHLLGEEFILSTLSANIATLGGARMGLHTDQWWMPQPIRPGASYRRAGAITRNAAPEFIRPDLTLGIAPPVVATALWMLSDFTESNGATEVVPGTHLSGAYPERVDQQRYGIVQAVAKAGTLLVFDGRLWHGTGANTAGPDRVGVLATFCAPQFRQQENQTLGLDRKLWPKLSPKLKMRLGFKVWNAYGRVEKQFAGFVSPFPERIGELSPEE